MGFTIYDFSIYDCIWRIWSFEDLAVEKCRRCRLGKWTHFREMRVWQEGRACRDRGGGGHEAQALVGRPR